MIVFSRALVTNQNGNGFPLENIAHIIAAPIPLLTTDSDPSDFYLWGEEGLPVTTPVVTD